MKYTETLKVVIVDDEYPIREMLRKTIRWEEHGVDIVGIVEDGSSAIDIIRQKNPDIVLTDIRMLNIDGIALSKWISENCPDIRVIFLSAYKDFEDAQMAFKYGVVDYILKPLNETRLFEVIEKIRSEIGRRKGETAEMNRMKEFIEEKVPLLHEKYILDLDNVLNSMKSYNWKETEEYIRVYFENCKKDRDILEFPYIAVFELLTVLKRLQALNGAFPGFVLSLQEIGDLKKIRNFEGMWEAAIQVFRKYFGVMVEQKSVNRNLVENVKEYVKNHCTDIINISDISSLFFISPAYLSRLFNRVCGVTFSGYLLQCRMEKAKELLIGTDAKIYEISSSAGFGSEKYFIRSFKKHFNISPMKFREEALKVNK